MTDKLRIPVIVMSLVAVSMVAGYIGCKIALTHLKVIRTERVELVDIDGKIRVMMGPNLDDNTVGIHKPVDYGLTLYNDIGKESGGISIGIPDNEPCIWLKGPKGRAYYGSTNASLSGLIENSDHNPSVEIDIGEDYSSLSLHGTGGHNHNTTLEVSKGISGQPISSIVLRDENGVVGFDTASAEGPNGVLMPSGLMRSYPAGKVIWSIP